MSHTTSKQTITLRTSSIYLYRHFNAAEASLNLWKQSCMHHFRLTNLWPQGPKTVHQKAGKISRLLLKNFTPGVFRGETRAHHCPTLISMRAPKWVTHPPRSRELGSRAGKFECMSEMVVVHPHRSNQIQVKAHKQAHSDLLINTPGSLQSSRTCSRLSNTFGALKWPYGCCFCFCDLWLFSFVFNAVLSRVIS